MLNEQKDNVENKGMRVSMNKSKVMISRERHKPVQKAARCRLVYSVAVWVFNTMYQLSEVGTQEVQLYKGKHAQSDEVIYLQVARIR